MNVYYDQKDPRVTFGVGKIVEALAGRGVRAVRPSAAACRDLKGRVW